MNSSHSFPYTFIVVIFHGTYFSDSLGPEDCAVRLNRRTAKNIHRRWALTMQEKFTLEEAAIQKMMADGMFNNVF